MCRVLREGPRARGGAPDRRPDGRDDDVEGLRPQRRLRRLRPERARPDDRFRLLDPPDSRRARFAEFGDLHDGIDEAVCNLRVLLEWVERDEMEGVGEAPYPPNFPKMPGEPKRVQPSRAKKTD